MTPDERLEQVRRLAARAAADFCPVLDVERIRRDFPILRRTVHGRPLVYLDNAATTQKPRVVIEALVAYYERFNANVHRGIHALAEEATEAYENARRRVGSLVGVDDPSRIVFTRNTTEALNLLALAWARPRLAPGDVILLTEMEHHSNLVPWQLVARQTGAELAFIPVDEAGRLDLAGLEPLLSPRIRVLALCHASNVLGTINPVAELADRVRTAAPGARVFVDAAQSVPHMPVRFDELHADALAFSGHKLYGPMGIGVLAATAELLEECDPLLGGGEMIDTVTYTASTFAPPPLRFEAGTPNVADAVGLAAAVEYLESFGMDRVWQHTQCLSEYAWRRLAELPFLRVLGPGERGSRAALVSFVDREAHPHDLAMFLDRDGIAIRAGHHCAMPLHERLGVHASARASFALYNSREEIDHLIEALIRARRFLGCDA
ncbi:MAG: cysteine desulfurase [Acidobacteriota bacterium]